MMMIREVNNRQAIPKKQKDNKLLSKYEYKDPRTEQTLSLHLPVHFFYFKPELIYTIHKN